MILHENINILINQDLNVISNNAQGLDIGNEERAREKAECGRNEEQKN